MNFPTSTHKRDWLFDADTLRQKYAAAQAGALAALDAARSVAADDAAADDAAPDAKKQRADSPISLGDEATLKLFFQVKLKAICQQQQLPSKVLNAAMLFFKRFYTQASCLEHDPLRVMPTCIYLACKVEEAYRSAESLCKALGIDAAPVLRFEVPLLQGLRFDLVVHSPYRALAGLFKDFDELRSQQSPLLDPQLLAAPSEALAAAHSKARAALDLLLLTDAPLLHPPGALAVAALRSGLRSVQLSCQQYLRHVTQRAAEATLAASSDGGGGSTGAALEQQHASLLAALAAIDALAAQQVALDEAALQATATEVDRTIKLWRKGLAAAGGKGGGGGAAAAGGALGPG